MKGKRIAEWDHTAALLAKGQPKGTRTSLFNPYRTRSASAGEPLTVETLHAWHDRLKER